MKPEQQHLASSQQSLPWWVQLCRWLWKLIAFLGISVLFALGINTLSTWFTSSKGLIPADSPAGVLLAQWPLTLLVSLCLFLLALMIWLLSRWQVPETSNAQLSVQDRERMLRRLHLRYEQMLAQSLQGVVQLELGLASRPTAVHNAASLFLRLPDQPEHLLPPHTSIVQAYELAQQELLILGEPGAGKSTLLLELAHHLVEQAEADTTQPLPIVLPLSSWATKRPALQVWLVEQVASLYNISRRQSQQWIQAEIVLPFLDGLDEMEEAARPNCIAAINTYHREHLRPLVVCSRTSEYDKATMRGRLALHTAVVVQPLSTGQVDAHLERRGKSLAGLRAALRKNTVLQDLATAPLFLQALIRTYDGTPVRALSKKKNQLRRDIWANYVQRMLNCKGNSNRYPLDITCKWLGWLAQQMRMRNQTIFSLEYLQPDWLPKMHRFFYQCSVILLTTLFVVLFEYFVWILIFVLLRFPWLINEPVKDLFGKIWGALWGISFLGLNAGIALGLYLALRPIQLSEAWSWKNIWFKLLIGLFLAMTGGAFLLLFRGLVAKISGTQLQLIERFDLSPNECVQRSAKNGLLAGLFAGFPVGLFIGLLLGILIAPIFGLFEGTFYWLFTGLLIGLIFGLGAFIQHYILRFWIACSGVFPLKAIPFLEDATARILLRRVGGGYSFSHRLLMDYFADLDTTASTTSPSPPTSIH